MRQYGVGSGHLSVKSSADVGQRIVDFLRSKHPQKTAENVSAASGIAVATVTKWLERTSVPNGIAMLYLTAAYGPEFLHAAFPKAPAWLSAAVRERRLARLDADIAAMQAEREGL